MAYGGSQVMGLIGVVLLAYATASAMPDLSRVCNLHHSSGQPRIFNPLSEARTEPVSSSMLVRFVTLSYDGNFENFFFFFFNPFSHFVS